MQCFRGAAGAACQPREEFAIESGGGRAELEVDLRAQRFLDVRAQGGFVESDDVRQPLLALAEHGGNEAHDLLAIVVEVREKAMPVGVGRIGVAQRRVRRFRVERVRPLDDAGRHAEIARDRRLARQHPAQGVDGEDRRTMLDALGRLNEQSFERLGDPEIQTRISQYEMAFRMQRSVPELTDLSGESPATSRRNKVIVASASV